MSVRLGYIRTSEKAESYRFIDKMNICFCNDSMDRLG